MEEQENANKKCSHLDDIVIECSMVNPEEEVKYENGMMRLNT